MSTVTEIEAAISNLDPVAYQELMAWWADHHLTHLNDDGYEDESLEAELLKGLEGEGRPIDAAWVAEVKEWSRQALAK